MKCFFLNAVFCQIFLFCSLNLFAQTTSNEFKSIYNYAIQEDVQKIFSVLSKLSDKNLTAGQIQTKNKYYQRFILKNEKYDYGTNDLLITKVFDIYRKYWSSILLKQKSVGEADAILKKELAEYLVKNHLKTEGWNKKEVFVNPLKHYSALLTKNNYYNNVGGKTGNLYDLLIWKKQDLVKYDAELPDGKIIVPVYFMKDIITLGWEEYATFGNFYPGGWSTDDSLFCVAKAYNVTTENFQVSYIFHEAQHFFDLRTFAEIPSWHLEYRAKLAELSKARETLQKILLNFTKGAKNDSSLTHPYAEYLVIHQLSEYFFHEDFVTDSAKWNSLPALEINEQAKQLLLDDSKKLKRK